MMKRNTNTGMLTARPTPAASDAPARRIGIDVGGVLIDRRRNDGADTSFFGPNYLATTAVPGAFDAVRRLVGHFGPEHVHIVSKAGSKTQVRTLQWFAFHDFAARTGFLVEDNVVFCARRADKTSIAARLRLTDFIDDHREVLVPMVGSVQGLYLFGPQSRPLAPELREPLTPVSDWLMLLAALEVVG